MESKKIENKKKSSFPRFLIFSFSYFLIFHVYLFILLSPSNATAEPDPKMVDGHALYLYWCIQCHGIEGKGDGVNATPDRLINPRDHTDAAFMSTRTDRQLEEVIKDGGASISKSSMMPPWRSTLNDQEIKALVAYLRKLCVCQFEGVASHEKLRRVSPDFR